ncbi:molybdenum cofactor synthesis domain-containing protein [Halarchaeum rubridurum]|nr:molybdopterin-binding protein [Halarchaeum rubridurum]MBP1955552.1 molybdenum cofactor synthesis domain-containing protein [Halarchaeum rubridurum]
MDVAVLTVGDEVLAGETTNTNAAWLGRRLTERGATVARVVVVPDDRDAIETTVRLLSTGYDAVLVTGGLGPTPDDVTMAAVAAAFDRDLVAHPDAVAYFETHDGYANAEADATVLPEGARFVANDAGVAPGAVVENCYVLPGVPSEMKAVFERVAAAFTGAVPVVKTVFVAEPESALVDRIEGVRERFDVTVGSYPGDGVRVRLRGTDEGEVNAAAAWLRERVEGGE